MRDDEKTLRTSATYWLARFGTGCTAGLICVVLCSDDAREVAYQILFDVVMLVLIWWTDWTDGPF